MHVPADDALARTVVKMEDKAAEERQRLKALTLAAAADHESGVGRQAFIPMIRQEERPRSKW